MHRFGERRGRAGEVAAALLKGLGGSEREISRLELLIQAIDLLPPSLPTILGVTVSRRGSAHSDLNKGGKINKP